jgi:hypothetical protein
MTPEKYKQLKLRLKEVLQENSHLNTDLKSLTEKYDLLKYENHLVLERIKDLDSSLIDSDDEKDTNTLKRQKIDFNMTSTSPVSAHANFKYPSVFNQHPRQLSQKTSTISSIITNSDQIKSFILPALSPYAPASGIAMLSNLLDYSNNGPSNLVDVKRNPSQQSLQFNLNSSSLTPKPGQSENDIESHATRKKKEFKVRKYQEIGRDSANELILPCKIGVVTLERLGYVDTRSNYFSSRYIYPVGFQTSRYHIL